MRFQSIKCGTCGKPVQKENTAVNRAKKEKRNMFCDKNCFGLSRRANRSEDEQRALKAAYDADYRKKNTELLKRKKKDYFQKTYDPQKAAIERKANYARHLEYLSSERYKKWKSRYDKKYRNQKQYGEFWESAIILNDLENELDRREAKQINDLENKSQRRKRLWQTNLRQKT